MASKRFQKNYSTCISSKPTYILSYCYILESAGLSALFLTTVSGGSGTGTWMTCTSFATSREELGAVSRSSKDIVKTTVTTYNPMIYMYNILELHGWYGHFKKRLFLSNLQKVWGQETYQVLCFALSAPFRVLSQALARAHCGTSQGLALAPAHTVSRARSEAPALCSSFTPGHEKQPQHTKGMDNSSCPSSIIFLTSSAFFFFFVFVIIIIKAWPSCVVRMARHRHLDDLRSILRIASHFRPAAATEAEQDSKASATNFQYE